MSDEGRRRSMERQLAPYRDLCGKCGARRIDAQIGLEATPEDFVATMVEVFRDVRRVLRDDGTCFLNLGDSYWNGGAEKRDGGHGFVDGGKPAKGMLLQRKSSTDLGLKPKDLCGMPWRVAFALQADGWYLRSDIIWAKPNPMPESVTDRPTRSHEYIFLLTKKPTYFYDADAIREQSEDKHQREISATADGAWRIPWGTGRLEDWKDKEYGCPSGGRNKRDVWTINSEPNPESHFATFPQKLVEPCILAGTSERGCCAECGAPRVRVTGESYPVAGRGAGNGFKREERQTYRDKNGARGDETVWTPKGRDTVGWRASCSHDAPSVPCLVLDPFGGSMTVGKVAERFGRRWVGLELSADYIDIGRRRTAQAGLRLGA